jgi:hypothetical protein
MKALIALFLLLFIMLAASGCGDKDQDGEEKSYAQGLLDSRDAGFQLKTLNDLKAMGQALSMYRIEHNGYPAGGFDELVRALEPHAMAQVPRRDGWGNAYIYTSDGSSYQLSSPGKDGRGGHSTDNGFDRFDFDHSITYADGGFTAAPAR